MQKLNELTLPGWIAALGGRAPVPAGGALSLVTLAGTASLSEKVQRLLGRDSSAFEGLSHLFLLAAAEDGAAYLAALREGTEGRLRCLEAGLRHLETALDLLVAVSDAFEDVPPALAADLATAGRLARAAADSLLANLAVNLTQWEKALPAGGAARLSRRLSGLKLRLEAV